MSASFKKLEAMEDGAALVVDTEARHYAAAGKPQPSEPEDRRMFTVPSHGWVNGPGRCLSRT